MSVRLRNKRWMVDIRADRRRYRVASPENSRKGALAYEFHLRRRLAEGKPLFPEKTETPEKTPTFKQFAARWYKTYALVNNKRSEQKSKRLTLHTHLVPFFGSQHIDKISSLLIEEYKALKLRTKLSPKTINNHLAILRKCLATAQDWDIISQLPRFKMLRVDPPKTDFLTPEDCRKLLSVIDDHFWRTMVLTAIKTGLRLGELKGLKWPDIDFRNRHLTVRRAIVLSQEDTPKSNRERHLPLTSDVVKALERLPLGEKYVFGRTQGRALHHDTPRITLHRYCCKAGIRPVGWHTLRHTFASLLASRNASLCPRSS